MSISKLNIGEAIKVKDIAIDNVSTVTAGSSVIVAVRAARGAAEAEEGEEEAAEGAATEAPAAELLYGHSSQKKAVFGQIFYVQSSQ